MKIRKVEVLNFRGIRNLEWNLPDQNIFCLIGKGDSAKTTILEAIRCVFNPQWNLGFTDSDFYLCKTENQIKIDILIGDLSDEFCSDQKYGTHLRGWDIATSSLHDEPEDKDELVLSVQLVVSADLEPKWKVVTNRAPEGVDFRSADRAKINAGFIGLYSEKQLTWGAGTALAKITEADNLNESLVNATRAAHSSLDKNRSTLIKFDEAATKSENVAKRFGIAVNNSYRANLDLSSISIRSGGLALHDGDIPLRQLGLGSRRILLCGIQKEKLESKHITLLDELELGLEPHRIALLIRHIKDDASGQYFLTTHSPSVLRELAAKQLYVVHKKNHEVNVIAATGKGLENLNIQGQLRSGAEAFLSTKVVVCEGATEVGFLRGLDYYWASLGLNPFSYLGIALLNAGGASKIKALATGFKALHYDVCVLADADAPKQFSPNDEKELSKEDINVIVWADELALEERVMNDLPWGSVLLSVKLAQNSEYEAQENVQSKLGRKLDENIMSWIESEELRKAIGAAAKASSWFKSTSGGELWVETIAPAFKDDMFKKSDSGVKLLQLRSWLDNE
jgi:predicted ATP-dependent endonuclease of OLD family